jgi:4-deoxy-L-threo-5-hexosulose-uronate ketol-isomerase
MQTRYESSPKETRAMNTGELRENFLVEKLIKKDRVHFVYSHYDRVVLGGAMPVAEALKLETYEELKANYFLERREIGIINVGGDGIVSADSHHFEMRKLDCVYLGKGTQKVNFSSKDAENPAIFFLLSSPAHKDFPNKLMTRESASPVNLGTIETANKRTIYKYIHADGIKSCQLVMGLTVLEIGSVWNTMPAHTHDRRMEAYFYFDVPENQAIFHFMGQPQETRHLLVSNHQAIISPPWSIHAGSGTTNYAFIWGMAGENQVFTDMDAVPISELR